MKGKQNMNMMNIQREIKFLSVEEERKFENNNVASSSYVSIHESVTYLGIYSEKAATLLNEVINWRIRTCSTKVCKEYYNGVDSLKGGGLFVKCNAEVVISSIGEVGLKFKEAYGEYIKKYIRAVSAPAEINKAIKDKIANELKKFWMAYSKYLKDHDGVIKFNRTNRNGDDVTYEYHETDYRILYEVLKGRDVDKLKAKYVQVKWDEMIGKKVEDQFVISAIETIQNEIAKIAETRDNDLKNAEAEYRAESNRLWTKNKENKERITNEAMEKIKELQNQINEMMTMGSIKFPQFTF